MVSGAPHSHGISKMQCPKYGIFDNPFTNFGSLLLSEYCKFSIYNEQKKICLAASSFQVFQQVSDLDKLIIICMTFYSHEWNISNKFSLQQQ